MAKSWGNWAALFVALVIGAAPMAAADEGDGNCDSVLAGTTSGRVELWSNPASGAAVAPGQWVDLVIRWEPTDFARIDRLADCLTADGRRQGPGSLELARAENTGLYQHRFAVPEGAPPGTTLCSQAVVAGPTPDGGAAAQRSQPVCLTVAAATVAAAPAEDAVGQAQSRRKPDESSTTTAAPATTTTEAPTTTTEAPTTTTTVAPVPEEAPRSASEMAQPGALADVQEPAPAPARASAPAPPKLPRTGSTAVLMTLAGLAIAGGGVAVVGSAACRRRRTAQGPPVS